MSSEGWAALTTIAGRTFVALWSLKGRGTRTTSPIEKFIVDVVLGIVPQPAKGLL